MNKKILVIDDEAEIRILLTDYLSARGYDVRTAEDGEAGLALFNQLRPDLVLLDLKMKKMDGDRVCEEIRRVMPEAKVFLVSALQDVALSQRLQNIKFDAFFEKPVKVSQLGQAIQAALA
ncbi:MAG: response regulator [Candidatus Omnitrophica bacterium]|nr:response regulator [Candidatus Omnitrophota bacterium]MDD5671254.1 response regulator [Candidatus Omnitrophota bacterium]